MTYAELQQAVANYMHRIDLAADIPGFIELARQRINRDLRVREMIKQATVTPTTNPFPVESDFLEMRDIFYTTANGGFRLALQLVGRRQLDMRKDNSDQAQPGFYSIDGLNLETAPGGIGIEFTEIYYAKEAELVNDTDTNLTLDSYTPIWLYASLIEGHTFAQDLDLMSDAMQKYTGEVQQANDKSAESESGASLQMKGASSWV